MTEYIILRAEPDIIELTEGGKENLSSDENIWKELVGIVEASSPRRALTAAKVEEGMYVAIPYRSWKPLTVKTEQVTKVTIG